MEKKKLLLVAISVGIFLVIAIGAAIVFTPKKAPNPSGAVASHSVPGSYTGITVPSPSTVTPLAVDTAVPSLSAPVDPVNLVRSPADVPGLKSAPEGTTRQGGDFYVTGNGQSGANPQTVINVPRPSSAAVPDTAPPAKVVSAPKPAAQPAPAPAPAAPTPAAQPAPAAPKPAAQPKVHDDYWVQTGAFSTIAKAEGVKESLASKGITSIIENRDVDGKPLFRVRVGPYTSQNEADYWLSLIKSISGFEDSQVRQTRSRR